MLDGLLQALDKCIVCASGGVILHLVALPATCKQASRGHMCVQDGLSLPAHSAMAMVCWCQFCSREVLSPRGGSLGLLLTSTDAMRVPIEGQFPGESRLGLGLGWGGGRSGGALLLQRMMGAICCAAWFLD